MLQEGNHIQLFTNFGEISYQTCQPIYETVQFLITSTTTNTTTTFDSNFGITGTKSHFQLLRQGSVISPIE